MIIFDTLSELESYLPAVPLLKHVITIMDRSLPYEETVGEYTCKEESKVTYQVDAFLSSDKGISFTVPSGMQKVLIALEGEEIISCEDSSTVLVMSEGRFALLGEGHYKKGMTRSLPEAVKDVIFNLPL